MKEKECFEFGQIVIKKLNLGLQCQRQAWLGLIYCGQADLQGRWSSYCIRYGGSLYGIFSVPVQ